jgi:hypothetical protein
MDSDLYFYEKFAAILHDRPPLFSSPIMLIVLDQAFEVNASFL